MIILILILAFLVRLINLNQSLWLDEAISAAAVKENSFLQIIINFIPGDVHPPLYYSFLDLWTSIFGYSEISLRAPSIIFGVLTCFMVYKIGDRIKGKKLAAVAALFFALNPLSVYYSQETRMYSMVAFLVTLAVYALLTRKKILFILALASALYTDYLPMLILPVFFFADWKSTILSVLLFLPMVPVLFKQLTAGAELASVVPEWGNVVGGGNLKNLALTYIKFIFGRVTLDNKILYAVLAIGVGLEYLLILVKARSKLFWAWLLVPIALGFLISLKVPIFGYHRFLFVVPAFCLLLALGATSTKYPSSIFRICFVVVVSLASIIFFNLNSSFHRENWRAAAAYINSDPGRVVFPSDAQRDPLDYYKLKEPENDSKVYLMRYVQELFDPTDSKKSQLERDGYEKIEERGFNGVLIWKYSK